MAVIRRDLTATIAQRPDWWTPYMPPEWYADALCAQVDPRLFYPEAGESIAAAKRVCDACPVRAECLTYAIDNHEHFGVWGGVTERNRRKIARQREVA